MPGHQDRAIRNRIGETGPNQPAQKVEQAALTERGHRLDESRPGHGLGLAIVREIVELYYDTLQFDRSPEL